MRPLQTFAVLTFFAIAALVLAPSFAFAAPRDVQMREFNFETSTLELRNFGGSAEPLDGWRFCSHDESEVRRYSASSGLNGVSIPAGGSIFIHFLNDAPGGDPTRINVSSLGAFATPFDSGSYGIQIYFAPVSFGNGNTIADHAQWSVDGIDNTSADERSDEAENGGVWTDQSQWIATQSDTLSIELAAAAEGLVLHSPTSYVVNNPAPPVVPSMDHFGLFALAALLMGAGFVMARRKSAATL
ncbi:MAG: hypothetical protein AB8G23_02610 [Myxococcota bacterium]